MSAEDGWRQVLPDQEQILWHGRPAGGIKVADFFTARLPFGLVFAAFAMFWITASAQMGRMGGMDDGVWNLFPLFGVPFFLVGLHMAIGVPFWDAYERSKSWYALTDQAAYIATEVFGRRSLKRYPIADMNALELEDGHQGTVWFNRDVQVYRKTSSRRTTNSTRQTYTTTTKIGFKNIDTPRTVYRLISELLNKADTATT